MTEMKDLADVSAALMSFRTDVLCSEASEGLGPMAELEYLSAVDYLSLARTALRRAAMHQAAAIRAQEVGS